MSTGFHAPRSLPPDGRYVVARKLEHVTGVYEAGAPFPWRELGMSEHTVKSWWWQGILDAAPPETLEPPAPAELAPATASPAVPSAGPSEDAPASSTPARTAPQATSKRTARR